MKRKYIKSGKYTKKAGTIINPSMEYNSVLFSGESPVINLSAKSLVEKNTGWPAICSSKLAAVMSSIELKLYYATNGNESEKMITEYKDVNKDKQEKIKKSLNNTNYVIKNADNIVEIEMHPLKKLLYNVNGRMNYADFIGLNEQYIDTIGNSYNLIEFDEDKVPVALYPLLGENIEIDVADPVKGTIKKYVYTLDNKKYNYVPDQI